MTSKVSIISQAFTLLGKGPVNDLESTPQTAAASIAYDRVYPTLLMRHPWHFGRRAGYEVNLINDDTGIDEFQYAYQLPADLLQLYRLRPNLKFSIYEDKIYTNYKNTTQGLRIDYTFKPDENKISAQFESALVYRMAGEIAMPVTDNANLAAMWLKLSESQLARAMFADATSNPSPIIQSNPLYTAHFV